MTYSPGDIVRPVFFSSTLCSRSDIDTGVILSPVCSVGLSDVLVVADVMRTSGVDFLLVMTPDGHSGWIRADFVSGIRG